MDCPTHMAGAEVSVANIANGVTVTIVTKDAAKHFAKKDKAAAALYKCPMGCATSDKPGKCPKCKMEMKKQ